MVIALRASKIFGEDKIEDQALLVIEGEKFGGFFTEDEIKAKGIPVCDYSGLMVLPGLVDSHIHGAVGADTMDATPEALNKIGNYLLSNGTTSWQPTTVTAEIEAVRRAVRNVKECSKANCSARIIGCFVEGPYITKEYKGAHPEALIRPLDKAEVEGLAEAGLVSVLAVAPEKEGAEEFISWAVSQGIKVSMAHSAAGYETSCKGMAAGADAVVHTFCGMAGLHHRSPNLLGATLVQDGLYAELIADGIHVQGPAMEILLRCKPKDKVILVSDAIQATGLPDGEYMLGVEPITVKDGISRVRSGSLAGSTATLLQEVRRLILELGVEPLATVHMASLNPCRRLGLDSSLGSIAEGKAADFIIVDKNYELQETWLGGKLKFKREN